MKKALKSDSNKKNIYMFDTYILYNYNKNQIIKFRHFNFYKDLLR